MSQGGGLGAAEKHAGGEPDTGVKFRRGRWQGEGSRAWLSQKSWGCDVGPAPPSLPTRPLSYPCPPPTRMFFPVQSRGSCLLHFFSSDKLFVLFSVYTYFLFKTHLIRVT